jgi:hypothetical protein
VLQRAFRVLVRKECRGLKVLSDDNLVVLVQRRDIANDSAIEVRSAELCFQFGFGGTFFAALELERRKRVQVIITARAVAASTVGAAGLAITAVGLAVTISRLRSVTRPRLAFPISRRTSVAITRGRSISRPRLTFTRRCSIATPRLTLTGGLAVTAVGLTVAIARRTTVPIV